MLNEKNLKFFNILNFHFDFERVPSKSEARANIPLVAASEKGRA